VVEREINRFEDAPPVVAVERFVLAQRRRLLAPVPPVLGPGQPEALHRARRHLHGDGEPAELGPDHPLPGRPLVLALRLSGDQGRELPRLSGRELREPEGLADRPTFIPRGGQEPHLPRGHEVTPPLPVDVVEHQERRLGVVLEDEPQGLGEPNRRLVTRQRLLDRRAHQGRTGDLELAGQPDEGLPWFTLGAEPVDSARIGAACHRAVRVRERERGLSDPG
jgi:hypothetical protein